MFTQGLDKNALRWVREKEVPLSSSSLRSRIDPVTGLKNGSSRGFGLPPPAKFRSGHLSNAIPVSTTPGEINDSGSNSGNDTDSEDESYSGRYSLDSSPSDLRDKVPNGTTQRHGNLTQRRPGYASDYTYSEVSSSRETLVGRPGVMRDPLGRVNGNVRESGLTDDESSDSAAGSEFSTTQVGSVSGSLQRTKTYVSEGYDSSVPSRMHAECAAEKNGRSSDDDDGDIPSAPPCCSSAQQTRQTPTIPACRVDTAPHKADIQEFSSTNESSAFNSMAKNKEEANSANMTPEQFVRTAAGSEAAASSYHARVPTFHASALGPWQSVIAYDACVRLCLHAWAMQCMEAPMFLENECALLREAFGLRQVLLQSEEELMVKQNSELSSKSVAPKPRKLFGKMKVQVRKVKMAMDTPTGCSISSLRTPKIKTGSLRHQFYNLQSSFSSGCRALRSIQCVQCISANGSLARQSLSYMHASTRYIQQVSGLLKAGVTTLRSSSSSYEVVQETYSCFLRLKSSTEEDTIRMQPGSSETHIFFPDGFGDDLIVEVQDSTGKHLGLVHVQVAAIADDSADKFHWWPIYHEPDHELVGKIQLYITYSTSLDEINSLKCGSVAETVAYDIVLEVAMKVQGFRQRNLILDGPWNWLLSEFASYYGVSEVYTKLRYLSYVMDVATPTADCLNLVCDLLTPVIMTSNIKKSLSHQENRLLGETKDQIEQTLTLVFENYKSLDESSLSGITEAFRPASGLAAHALEPAVKLYKLLHDILSPEVQTAFCHYFQVAAKRRSRRHLSETDEYVSNNNETSLMDSMTMSTAYGKMKTLCINLKNEIYTDIQIHNHNILPSFVDLPNLCASIYSTELCSRLRAFLIACPPTGPSPPVAELVIATSDFQRDLTSWKISPIKGGVDAKELFHLYILVWIQDKRLSLLESCKLDKVKWSGVRTQSSTTPFVDDMYERVKETLKNYDVIICRWPEYTLVLENAIADIEKATIEALDRQYADVLSPLKENMTPKKFGLKYVQKLTKRPASLYVVPDELGILLNSMKRMLDVLRPRVESKFKSWGSCLPNVGNTAPGERLSEVTVMLRSKFRNYIQAIVEKLAENMKLQNATKLKKILQDSKETVIESDVRGRMQPLQDQLANTISHLHTVFETHVFIAICRGYWDRIGQEILSFLENRKENRSWYKGSRIAVSILDDTFASQLQQLLGHTLQEKDLEPPRSIMEVRSMLCKDAPNLNNNSFYF
ncbi:LOW QUALITY PROTEIN: uncharacterized protein LOC129303394 [Prosopis cineraria]|uniref:LOW QUALITY PROTEIN: uncharacterized protein LOC129303394 n=1 Tax=Prosopis cineraria TaxID=364024 RepID=UPI00241073DA|nr:LOW QUALITY PROTEIN: uncharacterized protein LOC129303394 [Prosopis cineraria]